MLEIFTTSEYDNKIAVINGDRAYTFGELKRRIAFQAVKLKNKYNIILLGGDNFGFIIQFWASIFSGKNIYLISDKTRLNGIDFEYDIAEYESDGELEGFDFSGIDVNKAVINFYTSGSSGCAKVIQKSLFNLIREAEDLSKTFKIENKESAVVISTTSMCHMFGLTFHMMFPLYSGLKISTDTVTLPENVTAENGILISTPAFLGCLQKYNALFTKAPAYIFSAGSKLSDENFEYLEKFSNVTDIYGSTETGTIAYKNHPNSPFKLFGNVRIEVKENCIDVLSDYVFGGKVTINDMVKLRGSELYIKQRTDRLFKINEKRISADELELKLKNNELVKDAYIMQNDGKLVCLCALSPEGQNYLLKNSVPAITKTLKQHLLKYSEIVPQHWKFIDVIPMTQNGKVNKNLIGHLFNVNLSLPVILNRTINENSITYEMFIYNQCNFFQGHFPRLKIVPGVAQLYLAKVFANIHYNLNLGEGQWKRIKFSNIIEPDRIVNLKLEKSDKQVSYEYFSDDKKYASGVFLCDNIFKEL